MSAMAQIDMAHDTKPPARRWKHILFRFLALAAILLSASCVSRPLPPAAALLPLPVAHLPSPLRGAALLVEPGAGSRPLVRLLDRAQRTIFVETYILSDAPVVRALERAASQGVAVFVLLEPHPFGLGNQPQREANLLLAAGVHVRWTGPAYLLTHSKFMLLDEQEAVVSTANFSRAGFTADRDFLLFDRDRYDTRILSALFRADWDRLATPKITSHLIVSPVNARAAITNLVLSARHSIDVYAEEIHDSAFEALLRRRARGRIRIRVLLPTSGLAVNLRPATVRGLDHPYVHAKALLIDGVRAYVGSVNFSTASLDHNREVGLLVAGAIPKTLERMFARDWRKASG